MVGPLGQVAVRRMPELEPEKRANIFRRIPAARETIIEKYHENLFLVDLANAIAEGKRNDIFTLLRQHPIARREIFNNSKPHGVIYEILRLLKEVYMDVVYPIAKDRTFEREEISLYHRQKEEKLAARQLEIAREAPKTFQIISEALNRLPKIVSGRMRTNAYSTKIAWIGKEQPKEISDGKLVLVLSGGSAKGLFYIGFIKALQERGLWPDIVVGASAGAIAACVLGTGKLIEDIEDLLSIDKIKHLFHPAGALKTFILSLGQGIIGRGIGRYVRQVVGNLRFSQMQDVFIVTTVEHPANFGKAVIGKASDAHTGLELSSDIKVWQGAWGSAAMPGIIPPPTVKSFKAERLIGSEFGVSVERMDLPFAALDDGAVVEYLPIQTAELILKKINAKGLIVAVNLANLNPRSVKAPEHLSFRERVEKVKKEMARGEKWYNKPEVYWKAFKGWLNQEWERLTAHIAPLRAYGAYEALSAQSALNTIDLVENHGLKILLNPNADGELDRISLKDLSEAEAVKNYGYRMGNELADILLGSQ